MKRFGSSPSAIGLRRTVGLIGACAAVMLVFISTSVPAVASDSPSGFEYGSDTNGPVPASSGPVYKFTSSQACSGDYGFYAGRINTVPDSAYNTTAAYDAAENWVSGQGVGAVTYIDLEGPGDDSPAATTNSAAYTYGQQQGTEAVANWTSIYKNNGEGTYIPVTPYGIIFADIEQGNGGWSSTTSLNWNVLQGFISVVSGAVVSLSKTEQVTLRAGVYAQPSGTGSWHDIMDHTMNGGSGPYMWTNQQSQYSPPGTCASGWTASTQSATPYASYATTSYCFIAWQFALGSNQDWDQLNISKTISDYNGNTCS